MSVVEIINCCVLGLVGLGLTLVGLSTLSDAIRSRRENARLIREREHFIRNNSNIMGTSHWFSEDPPTMELISDLARGVSTSEARERWRKRREAKDDAEGEA